MKIGQLINIHGYKGRENLVYALPEVIPSKIVIYAAPEDYSEDGYFISIQKPGEIPEVPATSVHLSPMLISFSFTQEKDEEGEAIVGSAVTLDIESITAHEEEYKEEVEELKAQLRKKK